MNAKHYVPLILAAFLAGACDEEVSYNDTATDIYVDTGDETGDVIEDVPEDTEPADTAPTDTGGDDLPIGDMPGGDQTCTEVWTCLEGCGDDTACVTACVTEVCFISRDPLNTLLACKNASCFTHCRTDLTDELCLTCLDLNCPDELAACESAGC
jgi:hypothetical protein